MVTLSLVVEVNKLLDLLPIQNKRLHLSSMLLNTSTKILVLTMDLVERVKES